MQCTLWPQQLLLLLLSSAAGNWDVIGEQLQQHMDPQQTLLHASTANSRYDNVLLLLLLLLLLVCLHASSVLHLFLDMLRLHVWLCASLLASCASRHIRCWAAATT
jgi:hypothetical protein